jgi:acyl dehydratase
MPPQKVFSTRRGLYFEEFEVGQTIISAGRTVTEADVTTFAGLTGDWNGIHTDAVYAAKHPLGQRVAHGLLGLSIAVGLAMRLGFLDETVLAFRELDEWKFSLPIYLGDTIHMKAVVTELKAVPRLSAGMLTLRVEIVNQDGKIVQQGYWKALVMSQHQASQPT